MTLEVPPRQKSQRILKRNRQNDHDVHLQKYISKSKAISNINELLPGLNDISDAFEALPSDVIKYFTLLKEIDAKCISNIPHITSGISHYIDRLHNPDTQDSDEIKATNLKNIRDKLSDIIPCLEEKMHVTSIASDVVDRHLFRINNDYKLIIGNNEIPELIRIGPLNHPAMIMDLATALDNSRSAQSSRLETRREALAARKQTKDDEYNSSSSKKESTPNPEKKKRTRKDPVPNINLPIQNSTKNFNVVSQPKEVPKSATPQPKTKKVKTTKDENSNEPTYCYCNQVSFGEMVGCDGDDCKREWFHLPCIGFKHPPKGKWYCDDCLIKQKKLKRI